MSPMASPSDAVVSNAFWRQVAAAANADDNFRNWSAHLRDFTFSFHVGDSRIGLHIERGNLALVQPDAPEFVVSGPVDEWSRLVAGEKPYGAAINVLHGQLRVSGDPLASTWANRPLWQLFRLTRRIVASGGSHD
jgi:putative sterol carrier protein